MGKFTFTKTKLEGMTIVDSTVFGDERGFFMETFSEAEFGEAGLPTVFVQDNHSKSSKGVLRGLHFQVNKPQGKLVRVVSGEVFDVGVDIRPDSATYGQWVGVLLSAENKRQLYVPEGFAHGFLVLSDYAEFVYKCTNLYDPTDEGGIIYNDKDIAIDWPKLDIEYKLSEKDKNQPSFS